MTLFLVILMAGIFVCQYLIPPFNKFALDYLAMNTQHFLGKMRIWQAVTAVFLHGDWRHLLMNMIFFWIFGNPLAQAWRKKEFLSFFFLCGIAGSLIFYLWHLGNSQNIRGIGASAAIFGLMGVYAIVYGERIFLLFFCIPVKAKYLVAACFIFELIMLFSSGNDGVSHIAHLGGGICGILYFKFIWHHQNKLAGHSAQPAQAGSRLQGLEVMSDDED